MTERMRGLFLASMSHDLKAPLNAILGFAELVSRGQLTEGQRESATIIDQRSAAQYGQYSAPMYSISGFPPEVSGVPPLTGWILPVNEPEPILSSVLAGTFVTLDTTLARAAPVGPFGPAVPVFLVFSLITTKATTIASTAMMLPDAMRIRRRCSARRAAARCAAIFSRRLLSTLVLLALPMLATSNPCVSQLAVKPHVRWFHACVERAGVIGPGHRALC